MCTQGCQTFLWGGKGTPIVPTTRKGGCSCLCDDDSWSDTNIFGRASCVPGKAHMIYGLVGLVLSTVSFCHAAYHLRRQIRFHAENISASTSTAEKCRRGIHFIVIMNNFVGVGYFSMVLGKELRWSVVLLGVMQTSGIPCAISAARLWIYDTDPQHRNKSPPILALSNWLETPVGNYSSWAVFAAIPAVGVVFDVFGHAEVGVKLAALGQIFLATGMASVFWICGNSLKRVVDEALRHQLARAAATGGAATADEGRKDTLVAVKKKATTMTNFIVQQCVMAVGIYLFVIFSPYGSAAPLLLFGIMMAIMPPCYNIICVQLFAGRTKLRASGRNQSVVTSRVIQVAPHTRSAFSRCSVAAVAPTESTLPRPVEPILVTVV